jgi:hypothetical protein
LEALNFSRILAQKISYLPLCDPSRVYYHGVKIREVHERGEVIFYRQILSSSSNRDNGVAFMGREKEFGTLFII